MRTKYNGIILGAAALLLASGCGDTCPAGQELCGDICAVVETDRNNCGTCGTVCGDGEVCDGAGMCTVSCSGSLTECSGACIDSSVDPTNCGSCGNACAADEVCDGSGSCSATGCSTGLSECSGSCTDTDTDSRNCGACGTSCGAGEACVAGSCGASCGTGLLACGGSCVNPMVDATYCGATSDCAGTNAGATCGSDQACVSAGCVDIHACSLPPATGTAGVTLGTPSGTAVEGGVEVTYTVVLDREPCDNVFVMLTPDSQVTASTATLVFTPDTWDTAQTVSVLAVHDFDIEGDHNGIVAHAATSGDTAYDAITIGDATIAITDRAHIEHVSVPLAGIDTVDSTHGTVSDSGRYAMFVSGASNIVFGDTNAVRDAFVRDMMMGTTTRVSVSAAGVQGDGETDFAAISADGNVMAFFSHATNLVSTAITASGEVYRMSPSRSLDIANVSTPCSGCNDAISATIAISADGNQIAFSTRRTLLAADTETEFDVYVWDEGTSALTLESTNSSDANGTAFWGSNSFSPSLSATGQYVGFHSAAQNLATPEITVQNFHGYVKNRTSRALTRTTFNDGGSVNCDGTHRVSGSGAPAISSSGDIAAFHSLCVFTLPSGETADTNAMEDIFVRTTSTTTTTRVSVSTAGVEADGPSSLLGLSDDGRYVLFVSTATNLVAGDDNGESDVFVHDMTTRTTTRVSYGMDYGQLSAATVAGSISRNGNYVVLQTAAGIMSSDNNTGDDIYVVQLR